MENLTNPQASELLPPCPLCGTTNAEKSVLSAFGDLVHSHAELRAAVRSVGRQMLHFAKHDGESLERLRIVLKRADNIRRTLRLPDDYQELPMKINRPVMPEAPSQAEPAMDDTASHKRVQRKRMSQPRSLRVIRFPVV